MKLCLNILIVSFLFYSCNKIKDKSIKEFDLNNIELNNKINIAISNNDTIGYLKCYKDFSINGYHKEFLYYATIMAEKNNYSQAYFDIATILEVYNFENPNSEFLSNYQIYCVLKSYELGNNQAKQAVEKLFIKNGKPIPNSNSVLCK